MKEKVLSLLIIPVIALLLVTSPVYAVSSTYLTKAQKYIMSTCFSRSVSNQNSLLCYLFDKSKEQDTKISQLEQRIDELEKKVTASPTPTPTPTSTPSPTPTATPTPTANPKQITLTSNQLTTTNGPAVAIPSGYKTMTVIVTPSGSLSGWSPLVSLDGGTTWFEQHRFSCISNSCSQVTIPILAPLYKFSPGSGSGTVSATAILNEEPNSQVGIFASGVNYPYTSWNFVGDGMSTITLSIGPGDTPQHLTGVVLQKLENGIYVTKASLTCDGGAQCPYQALPITNGTYRFVVEGTGTNAIFGTLIRP